MTDQKATAATLAESLAAHLNKGMVDGVTEAYVFAQNSNQAVISVELSSGQKFFLIVEE